MAEPTGQPQPDGEVGAASPSELWSIGKTCNQESGEWRVLVVIECEHGTFRFRVQREAASTIALNMAQAAAELPGLVVPSKRLWSNPGRQNG